MANNNGPFYSQGVYRGTIVDHGLTKASTGTVQVAIKFKVLECLQPEGDVSAQYERTAFLPVTEKTMEYLVPKLQSLGYERDSIKYLNLNEPQHVDLRGQYGEFYCKHESNQDGNMREKWDVSHGGTSKPLDLKPPDAREIRNLDMLFGKARKAAGTTKPQSAPAATRIGDAPEPPPWVAGDDDVAF